MAKPVRLINTPIKMAIKLYVSAFKKKNQVLPIPENENEPVLTEKPNKRAAIKLIQKSGNKKSPNSSVEAL